mgnify:CR=1 FL=1
MLKILNCSKAFGGLSVLDNVTLEVEKHEIVSIMGPSGIGKSTLLRCICGLEEMDEGVIEIDGLVENRNHKIGYVFQNYNLFPHRTVFENCVDSLYLKKEKAFSLKRRHMQPPYFSARGGSLAIIFTHTSRQAGPNWLLLTR